MKYTFEKKLELVLKIKSGYPIKRISREERICRQMLMLWRDRYSSGGTAGLRRGTRSYSLSYDQKKEIVQEFLEKRVPLHTLCLKYDIARNTIKVWARKVRGMGYIALKDIKLQGKRSMGRPRKKKPQTELEKLQEENLRLRAENALLKKVKALVEEQKARALPYGRKSSTN